MASPVLDTAFFDTVYNRRGTGSIKYDAAPKGYSSDNLLPMWIADMDFKSPPAVETALASVVQHGIFGYTDSNAAYDSALIQWYHHRMHWIIQSEWNLQVPGVMFGISAAIRALTAPGDAILICQPVYYPFTNIIRENGRNSIVSELHLENGRYIIDFNDLEHKIVTRAVKLFLLCSPHNPVGRVWTREELTELGRICCKHGVLIISDEIHSDFVYPGSQHIPIASLSEELANQTITCTSPTKTFNLAGLQAANLLIPNASIREAVYKACRATGYSHLNCMAIAATRAAYQHGAPWLDALLLYLQENIALLQQKFSDPDGNIALIAPEGTYLLWLDCRNLGLSDSQLAQFFLEKAGLWLHNGSTFGAGGSGFMRMNIACPKLTLLTAIQRLEQALHNLK